MGRMENLKNLLHSLRYGPPHIVNISADMYQVTRHFPSTSPAGDQTSGPFRGYAYIQILLPTRSTGQLPLKIYFPKDYYMPGRPPWLVIKVDPPATLKPHQYLDGNGRVLLERLPPYPDIIQLLTSICSIFPEDPRMNPSPVSSSSQPNLHQQQQEGSFVTRPINYTGNGTLRGSGSGPVYPTFNSTIPVGSRLYQNYATAPAQTPPTQTYLTNPYQSGQDSKKHLQDKIQQAYENLSISIAKEESQCFVSDLSEQFKDLTSDHEQLFRRNQELKRLINQQQQETLRLSQPPPQLFETTWQTQRRESNAEDDAIGDAMYYLASEFKKGTHSDFTLDVYLKAVRTMSRKQFYARTLRLKIENNGVVLP